MFHSTEVYAPTEILSLSGLFRLYSTHCTASLHIIVVVLHLVIIVDDEIVEMPNMI
jgi:hypothetical protein